MLLEIIGQLLSEKSTERKTAATKLEMMLNKREVISYLDKAIAKQRSELTWDFVVQRISRYTIIEIEKANSLEVLEKRAKEIANLYRTAIRTAERNGAILKSSQLYSHIAYVIERVEKGSFVEVYSNVLLKLILSKRKHCNDLGVKKWQHYVDIYCTLLQESKSNHQSVTFASVVQKLMENIPNIARVNTTNLIKFFKETFTRKRSGDNLTYLEVMLSGMNNFCQSTMLECRPGICQLGEDLFCSLFNIWKSQAPSLKDRLLLFFEIQLEAHYFTGTEVDEDIYSWLNQKWRKHLQDLFEILIYEITHSQSSRKSYQEKLSSVAAILIDQMTRLEEKPAKSLSVCSDSGNDRKRIKLSIEQPYDILIHSLHSSSAANIIIVLQVVHSLNKMNSPCITIQNCECLSRNFEELMGDNDTELEHKKNLVSSILPVAVQCLKFSNGVSSTCNSNLKKVYMYCMKYNKDVSDQTPFMLFTRELIKNKIINIDHTILLNFGQDGYVCTSDSMRLLLAIIQTNFFPENHSFSNGDVQTTNQYFKDYPLRSFLWKWIMRDENIFNTMNSETLDLVVRILGLLLSKSPIMFAKSIASRIHPTQRKENNKRVDLQKTTFDDVQKEEIIDKPKIMTQSMIQCGPEYLTFVLEDMQKRFESIESSASFLSISLNLMNMVKNNSLTQDSVIIQLTKYAKRCTEQLTLLFQRNLRKNGINGLNKCLQTLNDCFQESDLSKEFLAMGMFNLMDVLLGVMNGNENFAEASLSGGHALDDQMEFEQSSQDCGKTILMEQESPLYPSNEMEKVQLLSCTILSCLLLKEESPSRLRSLFLTELEKVKDSTGLRMLIVLNESVGCGTNSLSSKEMLLLINLTRQYLEKFHNDQEVCSKLLEGIQMHIEVIQGLKIDEALEDACLTLVKVIEIFLSLSSTKYSPVVRCKLIDTLHTLARLKTDEELWKINFFDSEKGKHLMSSFDILLKLIFTESSNMVQIHIVHNIGYLISNLNGSNLKKLQSLLKAINDKDSQEDDNDAVIKLWLIKNILVYCPELERQALTALVHNARLLTVERKLVYKVLTRVACELGYESDEDYVTERLSFMLHNFVSHGRSIEEFPVECFGYTKEVFMEIMMVKFILPCLAANKQLEVFNKLREKYCGDTELKTLLEEGFKDVVFFLLPSYFKNVSGASLTETETMYLEGLDLYRQQITPEYFNKSLQEQAKHILLKVVLHLHNPTDPPETSSRSKGIPVCYPTFRADEVTSFISSLAKCYGDKRKSVTVFSKSLDSIPFIHASLAESFTTACVPTVQVSLFESYHFFVMYLFNEFDELEKMVGYYIVRAIIHRTICAIKIAIKKPEALRSMLILGFDILDVLVSKMSMYTSVCEEFSKSLPYLVLNITDLALKNELCSQRAMTILDRIIFKYTEDMNLFDLIGAVTKLDSFPDDPLFSRLNDRLRALKDNQPTNSIDQELQRHLEILKQINLTSDTMSICAKNLKKFLDENIQDIGKSNCLTSIANFIYKNISLMAPETQMVSFKCLGIIGPKGISQGDDVSHADCETPENQQILDSLCQLSNSEDAVVCRIATECLSKIFHKPIFLEQYQSSPHCDAAKYLQSFVNPKRSKGRKITREAVPTTKRFSLVLNNVPYIDWIQNICTHILNTKGSQDSYIDSLPICMKDLNFLEQNLPLFIYNVLENDKSFKREFSFAVEESINTFIRASERFKKDKDIQKKVCQIVNIIDFLRVKAIKRHLTTDKNSKSSPWQHRLLHMDFGKLSEAAYLCSMSYTSALFIEIGNDQKSQSQRENSNSSDASTQSLDMSSMDSDSSECKHQKQLLYDIYQRLGEEDVLTGIVASNVTNIAAKMKIHQLQRNHYKALLLSDMQTNVDEPDAVVVDNLIRCGLSNTTMMYLKGISPEKKTAEFLELQFEAAWRNGVWDTDSRDMCLYNSGIHGNIFNTLSSLKSNDEKLLCYNIEHATRNVLEHCFEKQLSAFKMNQHAFLINEIERTCNKLLSKETHSINLPKYASDAFDKYEPACSVTFQTLLLTQEIKENSPVAINVLDKIVDYGRSVCKVARENKQFEVSQRFISKLRILSEQVHLPLEWKLEEAKLTWVEGEKMHAIQLLKHLVKDTRSSEDASSKHLHPVALGLYGHWSGETKSENPVFIMENYLEPAIEMMEKEDYKGIHSPIDAYHTLAKYADNQYQNIGKYMKSDIFEMKQKVVEKNKVELNKYINTKPTTDVHIKRHYKCLEKQCLEDQAELTQTIEDQDKFLQKAIHNYCKSLESGDKYNLNVIRLCSLWFERFSEENANKTIANALQRIESRKFLPVIYQVAARLGTVMTSQCGSFNSNVEQMIVKCISDHPHHSVFVLMALKHADMDQQMTSHRSKSKAFKLKPQDKTRIEAASSVVEKLRKKYASYIHDVEVLALAYIELAYWDISHLKTESGPFDIPEIRKLRKIHNLTSIMVPTVTTQVDPSMKYENITYIRKFEDTFTHCGGVNLPKVVTCICSDGERRRQLIKGKDDLRQDAVMQQVFSVANMLLQQDAEARKKKLNMRTYKVIPLSRKSGLMEWCEGTIPLGDYLIGGRSKTIGAHPRYHPNGYTPRDCRSKLTNASIHDGRNSKYNVFLEIEKHFLPVLRYFFVEKFRNPENWFFKRLNYTKSTAVSSIVGYILGLGDRHCQNILIDYKTADIVHIDLGVAFEQGKLLPTPETIPFRLTRDLVDGMGVSGVEGVFRCTSEKTMEVMRISKESISTIVEVLLYDPLSAWTISSEKANRLQKNKVDDTSTSILDTTMADTEDVLDGEKNKMAERALLRLNQKLSGSEGGSYLSVEGHISYLIQEATSKDNLCKLYPGWQPWM